MSDAKTKLTTPVAIEMEEGKTYFLCTCGHSQKYPHCDGSHRAADTDKRSMAYACQEAKTVTYVDGALKG